MYALEVLVVVLACWVHMCVYRYMCPLSIYTHMHTNIHTNMYTHIHTYHTHTHIDFYTHTLSLQLTVSNSNSLIIPWYSDFDQI